MGTSISERALLVRFSVSQWTAHKGDKRAVAAIAAKFGCDATRTKASKILVAEEAIKAIDQVVNAADSFHRANTSPWSDKGERAITCANLAKYQATMRQFEAQFWQTVEDQVISIYHQLREDARIALNGLFNEADYPRDIRTKYAWSITFNPIPAASHLAITINEDLLAELSASIEERVTATAHAAQRDLYGRLAKTVKHAADTLRDPKAIFRDTLIENIRELCCMLPDLDLVGDPELDRIRRQAEQDLLRYSPETLREDPAARRETAQNAASILAGMAGMY